MKSTIFPILCAALLLIGCSHHNNNADTQRPPLSVTTHVVHYDNVAERHHYSGEVRSAATVDIRYSLGGTITALYADDGDVVRKGQLLAIVDSTQANALYQSALALLHQAEDAYSRVKGVHEKGVVTDVQMVEVQTRLEQARQNEKAAHKSLCDCRLTAPFDGVVAKVNIHVGQQVLPEQPLITITDTRHLEMIFSVPEQDMPNIQAGEKVEVNVPAIGYTSRAVIMPKTVVSNPLTHTYLLRAAIQPMEHNSQLFPGMLGTVRLFLDAATSITIPGNCVHTTPDGHAVWVVTDGTVHRRHITTDGFNAQGITVSSGLYEGDSIITAGYQKLYEGAIITLNK